MAQVLPGQAPGKQNPAGISLLEMAYNHLRVAQLILNYVHYKPHLTPEELREVLSEIDTARALLLLCLEAEKKGSSATISSSQGPKKGRGKKGKTPQGPANEQSPER